MLHFFFPAWKSIHSPSPLPCRAMHCLVSPLTTHLELRSHKGSSPFFCVLLLLLCLFVSEGSGSSDLFSKWIPSANSPFIKMLAWHQIMVASGKVPSTDSQSWKKPDGGSCAPLSPDITTSRSPTGCRVPEEQTCPSLTTHS